MAYPTDRIQLYDRNEIPLQEIAPSEVFGRVRYEEINAEHKLTLTTTRKLEEGWRALTVDGTGKWREWVVTEMPETHDDGEHAIGTYVLVWSLQYDLTHSYQHDVNPEDAESIGMGSTTSAQYAGGKVLQGVSGWSLGYCDAPSVAAGTGGVFICESAWSKLSKLVEWSGAEVDAAITVDSTGVVSRELVLTAHLGSEEAKRRFDWGYDLTSIRRVPDPGPYYCRIVPLGKGETEYADDDETTFEWPLDIREEEPNHRYYIEDSDAALAFRRSDGHGGYIYPTKAVSYDEDDPELLYNAGLADLHNHTRPNVSYEAEVAQFVQAGMNAQGVALGDETQCADRGFNPDVPLAVQGRVVAMEVDELAPDENTKLTIGQIIQNMSTTLGTKLSELSSATSKVTRNVADMSTARYLRDLLKRINAEISATGGYTYLVPGQGAITYNAAVADPIDGHEATMVTQMKGGSLRFAKSKQSGFDGIDDWNWTTVLTADGIAASLVTAAQLTTGYIGSASSGNYWDLDTGELRMSSTLAKVGSKTIGTYIGDEVTTGLAALDQAEILSRLTGGYANEGLYISNGHLYINASFIATGSLSGFKIGSDAIYSGTSTSSTSSGAVALTTANFTRTVAGSSRTDLRFAIGSKFGVSSSGEIYASGGEIGGFTITSTALYTGTAVTSNADNAIALSSADFTRTINLTSRTGLRFAIGDKFGVTGDGKLYGSSVDLTGKITATSGEVGGFTIGSSSIYNGKSSLSSLTSGVYISTGGISVGSGTAYTALADGYLYGGASANSTSGYVGFNNYWRSTGVYGARLAGRGCIALLTNGAFGIGSYYNFGSEATITQGHDKTITYLTSATLSLTYSHIYNVARIDDQYYQDIEYVSGYSFNTNSSSVAFTKGIMTTS